MKLGKVLNVKTVDLNDEELMRDARYIDRATHFGNPFRIPRDGDRLSVIKQYVSMLEADTDLVALIRRKLKDRSVVCWCAPRPCHGDIIVRVAAGMDPGIALAECMMKWNEES